MKIQCVFKRDREFGGWLYNGKVLAPNASAVLRRNLLKYLFLVKIVYYIQGCIYLQLCLLKGKEMSFYYCVREGFANLCLRIQ